MKKASLLRDALVAALPELAGDPSRLAMWVEKGSGHSRQTETRHFSFEYELNVLIRELTSDIALVALALFNWLRVHQPDLLANKATGFEFDADILDNDSADVLFRLRLIDRVLAVPTEAGGYTLDYLAEPDPLFDDALGLTDPTSPLTGHTLAAD